VPLSTLEIDSIILWTVSTSCKRGGNARQKEARQDLKIFSGHSSEIVI
jgi:hypothetical protein